MKNKLFVLLCIICIVCIWFNFSSLATEREPVQIPLGERIEIYIDWDKWVEIKIGELEERIEMLEEEIGRMHMEQLMEIEMEE